MYKLTQLLINNNLLAFNQIMLFIIVFTVHEISTIFCLFTVWDLHVRIFSNNMYTIKRKYAPREATIRLVTFICVM